MGLIASIAKEYLDVIDRIERGGLSPRQYRDLDQERVVLHRQLEELTGQRVTVAVARRLAASSR